MMHHLSVRLLLSGLLLLIIASSARAQQPFVDHTSIAQLEQSAAGALRYGLYGFSNPALLGPLRNGDLEFVWSDGGGSIGSFDRWGLFLAAPGVGFGVVHDNGGGRSITDYRIALAQGNRSGAVGIGYGWSAGADADTVGRHNHLTLGLLSRPNRYLSLGLSGVIAFSGGGRNGVVELAARPFGTELLTLFGDAAWREKDNLADAAWSVGAVVEPLQGVRLTGRYFESKAITLGVGFSFGSLGVGSTTTFNDDFDRAATSFSVRSGYYDRNVFRGMNDGGNYLVLNLKGGMAYRPYLLFDGRRTLRGTLDDIDAAREDATIGGIAINTSGMAIDREMLYELRMALERFKLSGKKVAAFVDRADIDVYHFLSVADVIVMDPLGTLDIRGYASGRSYYREMLDDLGIGFEEIRLYRYKSAYENFAREEMSEGEREQRQRMIDVLYELARADVAEGRAISESEFDRIVDSVTLIRADQALGLRLVDTVARWDAIGAIMDRLGPGSGVGGSALARYQLPTDDRWSEPPAIAVLYAIGPCAMDEGINARDLADAVRGVTWDDDVKAVVLRVDSPGGDALASDIVTEALKECAKHKPVIVSQGYVAASGGYWLSMDADVIVASPNTISGSIGVISAWLYDDGAFDTLGTDFDFVKRGMHSDLGEGPELPLIGVGLPHRNMTPEERNGVEESIDYLYRQFVQKVADGRGMTYDEVHAVAQGRVWMGVDAERVGLVDTLGGLDLAIAIARDRAGIDADDEIRYVEYPSPGLFDPGILRPSLLSLFGGTVEIDEMEWTLPEELLFRLEHNGEAMPMMPGGEVRR